MKSKVYSRSKIITGNLYAKNYHAQKIEDILRSGNGKENLAYHRQWKEYFEDVIRRQSLQRKVCGDVCVVIA